jgi:hypothetical protein
MSRLTSRLSGVTYVLESDTSGRATSRGRTWLSGPRRKQTGIASTGRARKDPGSLPQKRGPGSGCGRRRDGANYSRLTVVSATIAARPIWPLALPRSSLGHPAAASLELNRCSKAATDDTRFCVVDTWDLAARSTSLPIDMSDRYAASRHIARELRIDLEEAQRWCDAWERFAKRSGLAPSRPYYWDSARGWIDAQRFFAREDRSSEHLRSRLEATRSSPRSGSNGRVRSG